MFGGELARTLGPLLITAAISFWGMEGSYRVMPLGILASVVLFIKLKDISPLKKNNLKEDKKGVKETVKELIPFFIAIAGFLLFRAGMKSALTLYLPTYLTMKGETIWIANISLSILQLSGAAGTFGAGYISNKINYRNTLLLSTIASPVIMLAFISSSKLLMIPLLILLGILLFVSGPIMLAIVQETNTQRPAFINSIFMTIGFGISSLMVLLIGILGDIYGLDITYKICAGLAFLSVPFVFMLPKKNNMVIMN
jgi:FSR family fosmidomycin resistance protein-like MFS transporter